MRALRSCGYMVLSGVIAATVGCNKDMGVKPAPGSGAVVITNCIPNNEPSVTSGGTIVWTATDNIYQVNFVPSSINPAIPTTPNPFLVNATSVPRLIQGPDNCSAQGCYYYYTLTIVRNGVPDKNLCADPGIRIVPSSGGAGGGDRH